MRKIGRKSASQLANHRLQPLGHLSAFASKTRIQRALKEILKHYCAAFKNFNSAAALAYSVNFFSPVSRQCWK